MPLPLPQNKSPQKCSMEVVAMNEGTAYVAPHPAADGLLSTKSNENILHLI